MGKIEVAEEGIIDSRLEERFPPSVTPSKGLF